MAKYNLDKQIEKMMTFDHYKTLLLFVNYLCNEGISVGNVSAFDLIYDILTDTTENDKNFDTSVFVPALDEESTNFIYDMNDKDFEDE